jgi:hypothetical protein
MDRHIGAAAVNPARDSAGGKVHAEDVRFFAQALNRLFAIIESSKNNIDIRSRNPGDTNTTMDVVTMLFHQIPKRKNEVLRRTATR